MVVLLSVSVPPLLTPPPREPTLFPPIVVLRMVMVPLFRIPPPVPAAPAWLFTMALSTIHIWLPLPSMRIRTSCLSSSRSGRDKCDRGRNNVSERSCRPCSDVRDPTDALHDRVPAP